MDVVLVGNLLEATKDLEEGEILFCPVYYWAKSLGEKSLVDKIGGIVEESGEVRPPTSKELDSAKEYLLLPFLKSSKYHRQSFFYASGAEWIRNHWESLSEGMKKNEVYLNKEIVEDSKQVPQLLKYSLFLDMSRVIGNSNDLKISVRNAKTIIEKEARKDLIKVEMEKKENYTEALSKVLEFRLVPEELELALNLPPEVRETGAEGYIKKGKDYKECAKGERGVLIILPKEDLRYLDGYQEPDGIGLKCLFSEPEINKEKVYVVLGEFKIFHDGNKKNYLFGFPFFKVRPSSVNIEFRSKSVSIGKRKYPKKTSQVVPAKLYLKDFMITLEYTKDPEVIESGEGKKVIQTDKSILIVTKRDDTYTTSPEGYKICEIDIHKDGKFSIRTDYNDIYKVTAYASKKAAKEADEIEKWEPKEGVSWLIEEWTRGKKVVKSGKIVKEILEDHISKKKIFYLKEEKYENEENNEIDRYIKSKLEELVKKLPNLEREEDRYTYHLRKEREYEPMLLKPETEENKELIEEIKTGFIHNKVKRNLKYLEKIEELCFESREGERQKIKHQGLEEQKENITKISQEVALYGTGINVEKLKGIKKNVIEVLKLMSYSYPFLTQYTLKMILDELRERVSSALSTDVVPLEEIEMSIQTINQSISPADNINPRVLVLFYVEDNKVKVYINDGEEQRIQGKITEYVKMGIGGIEVKV
jgi:hypothetical protein